MAHPSLRTFVFLVSALALTAGISAGAFAGFEWKGPLTPPVPASPAASSPSAAPSGDNPLGGLEPVIEWNGNTSPPAMPAVKPEGVEKTSMDAADAGETVQGFASNIPLVIALQQVVPAGYRYSFAPGAGPGETVSWSGGKPWKTVLSDMLAARGLSYKIEGSTVVVGRFDGASVPAVAAAPLAPPAASEEIAWTAAPPPAAAPEQPAASDTPVALAPQKNDETPPVRTLLGRASPTGVTQPPRETVDIRREKPVSLLEKLGLRHAEREDSWGSASAPPPVPSSPPPAAVPPPPQKISEAPAYVSAPEIQKAPEAPAASMPVPLAPQTNAASPPPPVAAAPEIEKIPEPPVAIAPPAPAPQVTSEPASFAAPPAWHGAKGQTLRAVLKEWSQAAGVELYWSIDYDYKLAGDVDIPGAYDQAVGTLLDRFEKARPQPYGQLHQSGTGPRVLVIKVYDAAG